MSLTKEIFDSYSPEYYSEIMKKKILKFLRVYNDKAFSLLEIANAVNLGEGLISAITERLAEQKLVVKKRIKTTTSLGYKTYIIANMGGRTK